MKPYEKDLILATACAIHYKYQKFEQTYTENPNKVNTNNFMWALGAVNAVDSILEDFGLVDECNRRLEAVIKGGFLK